MFSWFCFSLHWIGSFLPRFSRAALSKDVRRLLSCTLILMCIVFDGMVSTHTYQSWGIMLTFSAAKDNEGWAPAGNLGTSSADFWFKIDYSPVQPPMTLTYSAARLSSRVFSSSTLEARPEIMFYVYDYVPSCLISWHIYPWPMLHVHHTMHIPPSMIYPTVFINTVSIIFYHSNLLLPDTAQPPQTRLFPPPSSADLIFPSKVLYLRPDANDQSR